ERAAQAHPAAKEIVFRDFAQQAEMGRSVAAKPGSTSREHRCAANRCESRAGESAESACPRPKLQRDGIAHYNSTLATFRKLRQPKWRVGHPPLLLQAPNPAKRNRPSRRPAQQCPKEYDCQHIRSISATCLQRAAS